MRTILALWLLFAASGTVCADTLHGVVIVVIDGDTVLFKPDHYSPASRAFLKVRLADIDAPETGQPFGEAATEALKARVLKQRAQLEIVATDAYGRKLGRLTVDARSVNAELVRRGLAWAYGRGGARHVMSALQREAQSERIGLWQDAAPTPPWAWRKARAAPAY
ncbi:MAG: thermonuclease family protein [Thiobacillus sp.]|nr:thermonuclease family protein [Thiobacillus sp.]MDP2980259.1 thermonuclease family protein [Thiobacillus sp.]